MNWRRRRTPAHTVAAWRWIIEPAHAAGRGLVRVVHSRPKYRPDLLAERWYACVYDRQHAVWDVLSVHRLRRRAVQACEMFLRRTTV